MTEILRSAQDDKHFAQIKGCASRISAQKVFRPDTEDLGFRRSAAYAALFVGIFLVAVMAEDWAGGSPDRLHGSLAVVNTVLGILAGVGAWFLYDARKNAQFLWIGLGFVFSAVCDGYFSILTTHPAVSESVAASIGRAVEWSWTGSRLILSVMLTVSWWGKVRKDRPEWMRAPAAEALGVGSAIFLSGGGFWAAGSLVFGGGWEPVIACFFLTATLLYFGRGDWRREPFDHWLLIGLLFLYWGEMFRWIFPVQRFFGADPLTHLFKTAGYFSVEVGFLATLHALYQRLERDSKLLEEKTTQVERANRELEDFTKTASHDLKAPLRAVRAYAERIQDEEKERLGPEARTHLTRMIEAAAGMEKKIEDLLRLSRLSLMRDPREAVDFTELVRQACEPLEEDIRSSGAQVSVTGSLGSLRCVRIQMLTAMQNLIQNAVKFSKNIEGRKPRICAGGEETAGEYRVWVEDNGIGVEAGQGEKIFEAFRRGGPPGSRTEGTGLGLFFVKKIAEAHGGRCWVESEPGKGARFVMTLAKNPEGKFR